VDVTEYRRRRPEESVLYGIVQENLETFLELAAHNPGAAVEFLSKVHELTVALRAMEKEVQAPSRNVA
jgi:hypothetical protein